MKTLGIIGCGWLGTRIGDFLQGEYQILTTTRSKEVELQNKGFEVVKADFTSDIALNVKVNSADALIISTNFPKEDSEFWLNNLTKFIGDFAKPIFLCSSTGIYADVEGVIDEDFSDLNLSILSIETTLKASYPQLNILRLGGLMGDERYLSKWFLERPLPKPGARINYIHYEDIRRIVKQLLDSEVSGKTYNVVAPQHPRKSEVYEAQTGITVPFGTEYNRIISSEKLIKEIGYTFVYPNPSEFPFIKS
jgi:hypothetical protein